ncbi:hypothetical protein HMSSN036_51840 [Paenibacillus macerans]|nr:hypothetical protein HMSSN036_51840 [Paenibacillus macerans]
MEHIDDYDLFDKDFESFVQLGREAFAEEGRAEGVELGRQDLHCKVFRTRRIAVTRRCLGSVTTIYQQLR